MRVIPKYLPMIAIYLLFFSLSSWSDLIGMRWQLNVVLICISLMIRYVEYFLLVIYMSSFERCLFKSFVHFYSMCLDSLNSLCIFNISPYSIYDLRYFLRICGMSLHSICYFLCCNFRSTIYSSTHIESIYLSIF